MKDKSYNLSDLSAMDKVTIIANRQSNNIKKLEDKMSKFYCHPEIESMLPLLKIDHMHLMSTVFDAINEVQMEVKNESN